MWILNFDYCKKLDITFGGGWGGEVERFWRNDLYYPNLDPKCEEDLMFMGSVK